MKKQLKTILTNQNPWIMEAILKELPLTNMSFVYGILPLSLVVGLHQFFLINIQISA